MIEKEILDTINPVDPEVADLINKEEKRQKTFIRMIASENYASRPVLAALASHFSDKYAEGFPHRWSKEGEKIEQNGRYYQGQEITNKLENLTIKRALALFNLDSNNYHVNVQPLSGAPANLAVLGGLLNPGDTFMGMQLAFGGHLTHGHPVNFTGKFFNAVQYGLGKDERLDYEAIEKQAKEVQPKLIICGASAYAQAIDFERFAYIAKSVGAISMADIAHISGLCSSGMHASPFPHMDIVTTTTHKVLRGPRGGMIYCRKEFGPKIDKAIIPGLQGGPHLNNMAALAIALKEANSSEYKEYANQVVKNAKVLADKLISKGFRLVTGGTANHLMLIDLSTSAEKVNKDASIVAEKLEEAGIVCNKNSVPIDAKPWKPSGIRIGTPATTTIGMKEMEMEQIAEFIYEVVTNLDNPEKIKEIRQKTIAMMQRFFPEE